MTIAVDVDLLRQHRLSLLAEADEIGRRSSLDPPDAGAHYAADIAEGQRLMGDAVSAATPHLLIGGGRIWSPVRPSDSDDACAAQVWAAWQEAKARWHAARGLEHEASEAWLSVLGRGVVIDDDEPPALDLHLDGADR